MQHLSLSLSQVLEASDLVAAGCGTLTIPLSEELPTTAVPHACQINRAGHEVLGAAGSHMQHLLRDLLAFRDLR